jgi:hypothetical protein
MASAAAKKSSKVRSRRVRQSAATSRRRSGRRWSHAVMERSDALDLEPSVFRQRDPRAIALSLRRSAERSERRKSPPYRSAMSMLSFYINRAGRNLPAAQLRVLERAKDELRRLYGRD